MARLIAPVLLLIPLCLCLVEGDIGKEQRTFYESSGEEHEGVCKCTIATSWSELEEYKQLQDIRSRLTKAVKLQETMDYRLMVGELEDMKERLLLLEDHINNQSVATSVTELFRLQKRVRDLVGDVETLNQNDTLGVMREHIFSELNEIKKFAESAWDRNPYRQRNYYEEQLSILRERLYEGHEETRRTPFQGDLLPPHLPPSKGWCDNGKVNFGRPYTHKYTHQGGQNVYYNGYNRRSSSSSLYGDWHKDSRPLTDEDRSRICNSYYSSNRWRVRCYSNYTNFVEDRAIPGEHDIERSSPGFLLHMGSLVYVTSSGVFTKKNLTNNVKISVTLKLGGSSYNVTADEGGLWLIYSINGKIGISKFDTSTYVIRQSWVTDLSWRGVCAYFMMCGKLYTVRDCNDFEEARPRPSYVYDTVTSQSYNVTYHLPSLYKGIRNLGFNSRERLVFGWDQGHMVTFPVIWSNSLT